MHEESQPPEPQPKAPDEESETLQWASNEFDRLCKLAITNDLSEDDLRRIVSRVKAWLERTTGAVLIAFGLRVAVERR